MVFSETFRAAAASLTVIFIGKPDSKSIRLQMDRQKVHPLIDVPETLGVLYLEELSKDVNEILIFDTEFFD